MNDMDAGGKRIAEVNVIVEEVPNENPKFLIECGLTGTNPCYSDRVSP